MSKNLKAAIIKTAKANPTTNNGESQAERLIKNADIALGIDKENDTDKRERKSKTITKTYTMGEDDLLAINDIVKKIAISGEIVNKTEVIRMGILVLKQLDEEKLKEILEILPRRRVGGWYI